jgi:uncharacterized protein DUF4160
LPEISRFFGIVIAMFYKEHEPPHFHARYGDQRAIIRIDSLVMLEGSLSPRVLGMVMEWAALHRAELIENWQRARALQPLEPIAPLE